MRKCAVLSCSNETTAGGGHFCAEHEATTARESLGARSELARIADALEAMVELMRVARDEDSAVRVSEPIAVPWVAPPPPVPPAQPGERRWDSELLPSCAWRAGGCLGVAHHEVVMKDEGPNAGRAFFMCDSCAAIFDPLLGAYGGLSRDFARRDVLVPKAVPR